MMQCCNTLSYVPAAAGTSPLFRAKDPGSTLTHGIAFCTSVAATPWLLVRAGLAGMERGGLISLSVFLLSMTLLYGASTAYHALDISPKVNKVLKKIDHCSVFLLIAGTYTPFCTLVLGGAAGKRLLITVWLIALVGMLFKLCYVTCPKWVSSVIYIALGWACAADIPAIRAASSHAVFFWLLAGGLFYTVGGVIYSLKLKALDARFPNFGTHELFHVFVMAGSLCHYVMLLRCIG